MSRSKNETVEERYKRWWEGKYCKSVYHPEDKFRYVQTVEFVGPPSGFFGSVTLHYLDGTSEYVQTPTDTWKPRKCDVLVEDD